MKKEKKEPSTSFDKEEVEEEYFDKKHKIQYIYVHKFETSYAILFLSLRGGYSSKNPIDCSSRATLFSFMRSSHPPPHGGRLKIYEATSNKILVISEFVL